jgi:hypothetical protein
MASATSATVENSNTAATTPMKASQMYPKIQIAAKRTRGTIGAMMNPTVMTMIINTTKTRAK